MLREGWKLMTVEAQQAFQAKKLSAGVALDQRIDGRLEPDRAPGRWKKGDQRIDPPREARDAFFTSGPVARAGAQEGTRSACGNRDQKARAAGKNEAGIHRWLPHDGFAPSIELNPLVKLNIWGSVPRSGRSCI